MIQSKESIYTYVCMYIYYICDTGFYRLGERKLKLY